MTEPVRDALGNVLLKGEASNRTPNSGQIVFRSGFSDVIASGWQPNDWQQIGPTGAGQTASQSAGNGVLASGTTANSETIMRAKRGITTPCTLRYQLTSARACSTHTATSSLLTYWATGWPLRTQRPRRSTSPSPTSTNSPSPTSASPCTWALSSASPVSPVASLSQPS